MNYKRRSPKMGGEFVTRSDDSYLTNQWIIPYNPSLLLKFQSHINVEYVIDDKLMKYLFGYITKGDDFCLVEKMLRRKFDENGLEIPIDEIYEYINCRYVTGQSACWELYGFARVWSYPPVENLPIHLENQQYVVYTKISASAIINPN
jgi:hypothetical protein